MQGQAVQPPPQAHQTLQAVFLFEKVRVFFLFFSFFLFFFFFFFFFFLVSFVVDFGTSSRRVCFFFLVDSALFCRTFRPSFRNLVRNGTIVPPIETSQTLSFFTR